MFSKSKSLSMVKTILTTSKLTGSSTLTFWMYSLVLSIREELLRSDFTDSGLSTLQDQT